MSAPSLRATGVFILILGLEVALVGATAGRYCTSDFSWSSALSRLMTLFTLGFIVSVLVPLALSVWATRRVAWPNVDEPDPRFWFAFCCIVLPVFVATIVLLAVPAHATCAEMGWDKRLMIADLTAIALVIAWGGCGLIACLHPRFYKGFGRGPLSAASTCAVMFALGATWQGCGSWDILLAPSIGAVILGVLGATIPARPVSNVAFIALRLALPLAALAIGPHLPVWNGACFD